MSYYKGLIKQSISRSRESTLGMLGIAHPGLRKHLNNVMTDELGSKDCFLASPVFEHTFGWEEADETFESLSGNLLNRSLVNTLSKAKNYDFPLDAHPYKHQITAWRELQSEKPKSTIITTGTGSGKTECFMVPILNDLIGEYEQNDRPLVGVRALFLYPLNALINSQQERLDAWTNGFGDGVRFCLYNGTTEEKESKVRKEQTKKPNHVLSRELLRKSPPPILMTNSTMLEYMLVRQIDNPIIQASKEAGSLRWIVLDEAHTYIGSQAAELSLLLRRVVHAFGKKSSEIRFVATSATIADDDASDNKLREYLSGLAGVSQDQVVVIGGRRRVPDISPRSDISNRAISDIAGIDVGVEVSPERFEILTSSKISSSLRHQIVSNKKPQNLGELLEKVQPLLSSSTLIEQQYELLDWMDLMTGTREKPEAAPFLKGRMHLFQRMLHGLWCCANPECSAKPEGLQNWPFGNVYVSERSVCDCHSPVYELGFCSDCKAPHLVAEDNSSILQQCSPYVADEFALNHDEDEDSESGPDQEMVGASREKVVLAPYDATSEEYISQLLDIETKQLGNPASKHTITVNIASHEHAECSSCGTEGGHGRNFLRMSYLGAPFYVANAVPTVLEYCPDPDKKDCEGASPEELPGRGRKLITFTDSRQGTARMAVRMQQEAERSRLRGAVFQVLRNKQSKLSEDAQSSPTETYEEKIAKAKVLESIGYLKDAQKERDDAEILKMGGSVVPIAVIPWDELVNELAATKDISRSILDYNKYANPALFSAGDGGVTMAKLLLAREFSRRPKNQNSSETLALTRVAYKGLDDISIMPEHWQQTECLESDGVSKSKLNLSDWKDFLKMLLDFYVRENTFIPLPDNMRYWMGSKFSPKKLYPPASSIQESSSIKIWPQVKTGMPSRPIKLLEYVTGISRGSNDGKDKINYWLKSAWEALVKKHILESQEGGYALSLSSLTFSLSQNAWVCPVTRRMIDTTFRGVTPYLPRGELADNYRCTQIELPNFAGLMPGSSAESQLTQIRRLVHANDTIKELRDANLWSNLSDRTVEGGFYYRTAEHSAQQPSKKLEQYEDWFKKGKINVLNCSTTMEMGVDIGGISAVVMNNVPPHPANYLQRSGRAGRRSEARAIAYTLCKSDPHNQRVFKKPDWPFETAIAAPSITLSSDRIVQRHINSFFLASFLGSEMCNDDNTKLSLKWFFNGEDSPYERFIDWLSDVPSFVASGVGSISRGTKLEKIAIENLIEASCSMIHDIQELWVNEYKKLNYISDNASDELYKRAIAKEKSRHEDEYLLKELSVRAYLPGYGFPTNVVNLNTYNIEDFLNSARHKSDPTREDNAFNLKEMPTRGLDVAIREYAPGAQLVIDGRVYRSAGVSLQWHAGGAINEAQKFDVAWRCSRCGATGVTEYAYSNSEISCTHCGAEVIDKKTVLRPAGFLTDFYEPTSNDVSTQKYIGIERPRVSLDGDSISLPDYRCGFIRYGHEGSVFYHSSGEHGTGYAVCLACGRADSMLSNGDVPRQLEPGGTHRPVGGFGAGKKEEGCSNEAVKKDLFLGFSSKTDVLEWVPRNPLNGRWLSDNPDDQVIAMTLAVALRDSIARSLGIESTEMGFSVRLDKDIESGAGRSIVQVYDQASGGAGFVVAGATNDLVKLIENVASSLECTASCDNVCSHCLAGMDSRVEQEKLNRIDALSWVRNAQYLEHMVLPDSFSVVEGVKYIPYDPMKLIQKSIREGASLIYIPFGCEVAEWDLGYPGVLDSILTWQIVNKVKVTIGLPQEALSDKSIIQQLSVFAQIGVSFIKYRSSASDGVVLSGVIQGKEGGTTSIYSDSNASILPGESWIKPGHGITWGYSQKDIDLQKDEINTSGWGVSDDSTSLIQVTNELNGDLSTLGERFKTLLVSSSSAIKTLFECDSVESVEYSDRYLKTPWSVMLLGQFLMAFKGKTLNSVTISTLESSSERSSYQIHHNWPTSSDQEEIAEYWVGGLTEAQAQVKLHRKPYDIQHGREIVIRWASGKTSRLLFDQGMGYWSPRADSFKRKEFDFNSSAEEQEKQMIEKYPSLKLVNSGNWPTFITVLNE